MTDHPLAHTVSRALTVAGCGKTSLYAAIKAGELPAKKMGRRTLIIHSDLMTWLENLPALKPAVARNCHPSKAADRGDPVEDDQVT
jgi:excisionase family DNA binding protein